MFMFETFKSLRTFSDGLIGKKQFEAQRLTCTRVFLRGCFGTFTSVKDRSISSTLRRCLMSQLWTAEGQRSTTGLD